MDNVNGALAFKATLDINDFNVSAQAMERHIRQASSTAVAESAKMDDSILSFAQNGAKYIVSYLVWFVNNFLNFFNYFLLFLSLPCINIISKNF